MPHELITARSEMAGAALAPETVIERLWDEDGLLAVITVADVLPILDERSDCGGDIGAAVGDTKRAVENGDRETVLCFVRWYGVSPSRVRPGFLGGDVWSRPVPIRKRPQRIPRMRPLVRRRTGHRLRPTKTKRAGPYRPPDDPEPEPVDRGRAL